MTTATEFRTQAKKKKLKKRIRAIIIAAVIIGFLAFSFIRARNNSRDAVNMLYSQAEVSVRDMTVTVSGTATVEPNDSYKVTTLISGEILSSPLQEGDRVEKDDLLFTIDASDREKMIAQSELAVRQAELAYNEALSIKATASGTVQQIYVDPGNNVSPGTAIAYIADTSTMKITLPFLSEVAAGFWSGEAATLYIAGTGETLEGWVDAVSGAEKVGAGGALVREVTIKVENPGGLSGGMSGSASVGGEACAATGTFKNNAEGTITANTAGDIGALSIREGSWVQSWQSVASMSGATIENYRLSLENARLSLESARDSLDNYEIQSPISGMVVEMNVKAGDNVEGISSGNLAVIYDMSLLQFKMDIDELDIRSIKIGQKVRITADALDGVTLMGHVEKININGNTVSGVTSYPVTVVIDEAGDLLPGMNVSADIIVEEAKDVLTVPLSAVQRGNTVLVAGEGALNKEGGLADAAKLVSVDVTIGRSDNDYIEVLTGLAEGDIVWIENSSQSFIEQMMAMGMSGPPQ